MMFILFHPFDMESQTLDPGPLINSRKIDVLDTLEPQGIINGTIIPIESAPFCAIIRFQNGSVCSGSIIDSKYILTAQHCTLLKSTQNPLPLEDLSVVVGSSNKTILEPGSQIHFVKSVLRPSGFINNGNEFTNDLAIIELKDHICFSEKIKPIKYVEDPNFSIISPTPVQIYGWGNIDLQDPPTPSDNLRTITLPVMNTSDAISMGVGTHNEPICVNYFGDPSNFALEPGKDNNGKMPTDGDSGGPVVMQLTNGEILQVGVFSHRQGCQQSEANNFPTWAVNISKLAGFIQTNTTGQKTYINSLQGVNIISNKVYSLSRNLTVENGNDLTITGTGALILLDNVTVPPGSKINLYGEISGYNAHCRAQGVAVYGIDNNSQFSSPGQLNLAQGQINTFTGSKIKYCKDGVSLISGGIGKFIGTAFTDNVTGVKIEPYDNFKIINNRRREFDNLTSFSNCNFNINPSGPNPNQIPASGITMERVRGIKVSKCLFNGYYSNPDGTSNFYRIGINNISAGLLCRENCSTGTCPVYSGSQFIGLRQGILFNGTQGSGFANIVSNATFDHNDIGVNAVFMNGSPEIYLNKFYVVKDYFLGAQFFGESSGWSCEQNEFIYSPFTSSIFSAIGSFCKDIGVSNNTIRNNKYTTFRAGNLANGVNGINTITRSEGLNYDCNKNFSTLGFDFATEEIRALQFTRASGNLPGPAYNIFSFDQNPAGTLDFNNSGTTIQYYFKNNAPLQNPNFAVGVNAITREGNENCPNKYCFGNCGPVIVDEDTPDEFFQKKNLYNSVLEEKTLNAEEKRNKLSYIKDEMSGMVVNNLIKYQSDSTSENKYDSLLVWLERQHSFSGDLHRIALAKNSGNNTMAYNIWEAIPNRFSELNIGGSLTAFKQTYGFLLDRPRFEAEYQDTTLLENLRQNSDARISNFAIGLLANLGRHYSKAPIIPEYTTPEFVTATPIKNVKSSTEVFPNPVDNLLHISSISNEAKIDQIIIINALGSIVFQNVVNEFSTTIPVVGYPSGLYFIDLRFEDGTSYQQSFIKK
jgi:secreted trypsin-like serine protease